MTISKDFLTLGRTLFTTAASSWFNFVISKTKNNHNDSRRLQYFFELRIDEKQYCCAKANSPPF